MRIKLLDTSQSQEVEELRLLYRKEALQKKLLYNKVRSSMERSHWMVLNPSNATHAYTGELGYDRLNGTMKIGPSYAKSIIYIGHILDMHGTGTKHIVRHRQTSVV